MKSLIFFIHCHRIDFRFHRGATSSLDHWTLKLHVQSGWLHNLRLWAKPYCQFWGWPLWVGVWNSTVAEEEQKLLEEATLTTLSIVVAKQHIVRKSIASCTLAVSEEAEETSNSYMKGSYSNNEPHSWNTMQQGATMESCSLAGSDWAFREMTSPGSGSPERLDGENLHQWRFCCWVVTKLQPPWSSVPDRGLDYRYPAVLPTNTAGSP